MGEAQQRLHEIVAPLLVFGVDTEGVHPFDAGREVAGLPQGDRLLHLDWHPLNLLVDEASGELSGIVDWDDARRGHPLLDLARTHSVLTMEPSLAWRPTAVRPHLGAFAEAWAAGYGSEAGAIPGLCHVWAGRVMLADLHGRYRDTPESLDHLRRWTGTWEEADPLSLRDAWEAEARDWVAWARTPGHDSYWRFHRDRFLRLLPAPTRLTLDLGCGEGRFPRDLKARGYEVVGVDASPTLIEHAREGDPESEYHLTDAAGLPLADGSVQLVTAFMSLHDMDDMEGAIEEAARVLMPGGRLCAAVVHPINSGGKFASSAADAAFVMRESYFQQRRYADTVERDGLRMTFTSRHRPLEEYFAALESAGLLVERLVEIADTTVPPGDRWQRIPLFVHLRAVRP